MNVNLSENPHCLILPSSGLVLFSSQRRSKGDCHQQELQPGGRGLRQPVSSCFSRSLGSSGHKGDDVILSAWPRGPRAVTVFSGHLCAAALCQLGGARSAPTPRSTPPPVRVHACAATRHRWLFMPEHGQRSTLWRTVGRLCVCVCVCINLKSGDGCSVAISNHSPLY